MSHGRSDSKAKKREDEKAVFEAFLTAHPTFAARVLEVKQEREDSHADIRTKLDDGTWVAWQLAEWLEESQMKESKKAERLETSILEAIGEQGPNSTKHIYLCRLSLKERVSRFDKCDATRLRREVRRMIRDVDSGWRQSPQGHYCTAFNEYPALGKYLDRVHFEPRVVPWERWKWPADLPWILFEGRGGSYDGQVLITALEQRIQQKAKHYGAFGHEDVRLIVFYNQAILYNTPFDDLEICTFEDVAAIAKEISSRIQVPFTKAYLLSALYPNPEAFEVYPTARRCD